MYVEAYWRFQTMQATCRCPVSLRTRSLDMNLCNRYGFLSITNRFSDTIFKLRVRLLHRGQIISRNKRMFRRRSFPEILKLSVVTVMLPICARSFRVNLVHTGKAVDFTISLSMSLALHSFSVHCTLHRLWKYVNTKCSSKSNTTVTSWRAQVNVKFYGCTKNDFSMISRIKNFGFKE